MRSKTGFKTLVICAVLSAACSSVADDAPKQVAVRIALIGDSTMASYDQPPPDRPDLTGWGQVFGEFFQPHVEVKNFAASGRSSKSFLSEKRWPPVLAYKPGFVFIQFGHNDEPGKGPERATDPATTFRDNLRQYIDDARSIKAMPILVTPVARRTFDGKGNPVTSLKLYAEAMHAVGKQKNVPVIDLHAASFALYAKLGDAGSADLSASATDRSHFSRKGGLAIAGLVAAAVRTEVPELAKHLKPRVSRPEPEASATESAPSAKRGKSVADASGSVRISPGVSFEKLVLTDDYFCDGVNVGDFNRDGKPDVVAGPFWYAGPDFKARHEFYPAKPFPPADSPTDSMYSYVHDFNADGWDDILVLGRVHLHEAFWYENPRGGDGLWKKHFVFHRIQGESPPFLDVNGDGRPELVAHWEGQWGLIGPVPNEPEKPWTFQPITEPGEWPQFYHGTGVGDVNGDGRLDLLLNDGWWEQPAPERGCVSAPSACVSAPSDGLWTPHRFKFADRGGAQMFAYDVDGDGDNDILTALDAHGWGLAWFEQTRDGDSGEITFHKHVIMGDRTDEAKYGVAFSQPHALDLADLDGDGLKDLIVGKRRWAHGPNKDIEPNAAPVVYWFRLERDSGKAAVTGGEEARLFPKGRASGAGTTPVAHASGSVARFVPHLIDDKSGVGLQIVTRDLNADGRLDVLCSSKLGVFAFLNRIEPEASATEPPDLRNPRKSVADASGSGIEFFERKIRPVLVEHCYECHSAAAKKLKGGLRLDTPDGIRKGGDTGPIVVSGKPEESLLLDAISYSGDASVMPPDGKLPDAVIADVRKWIALGAPLPAGGELKTADADKPRDWAAARQFWSFQPVEQHPLPAVSNPNWPRSRIDHFVLRKLDDNALRPAPEADRRTLIRRLSFDLIGLPPTYADVEAFVADESSDAYERLVVRLLASPQYGERWGRHWLDVARYAEDNPTSESTCKPPRFPFRYRDWVIRALNDDLAYDDFVRRQLAADLFDVPPAELAALGFLGLSPVYHKEPKLAKDVIAAIVADEWDERLDTITRGFLGLTVACARCHDHKFDPITTEDYYALAGVVASTQLVEWPLVETDRETAAALTDVQLQIVDDQLRLDYAKTMSKTAKGKGEDPQEFDRAAESLDAKLKQLKETKLFDGPVANAVRDAGCWINGDDPAWTALDFVSGKPRDLPVFLRGSVTNPGEIVPRRFLEVLSLSGAKPFQHGSGRRELAECLVIDAASLTARVIVNRVWGWHFGQPLVTTPSNFGHLGDRPSHPELLDDLAARFIAHGWSLKWLHREIVLSSTWRQASAHNPAAYERDPDNRLLWRMNRRRLEAESWRDAVLAVSGQLDPTMTGPSASLDKLDNHRRTIYGTISRQKVADVLRLFDFPDAKSHTETRLLTTTPLQQLYLLNSPFLQHQAAALTESQSNFATDSHEETVRKLFRIILQRDPTGDEISRGLEMIASESANIPREQWTLLTHALLASNEFLFVD